MPIGQRSVNYLPRALDVLLDRRQVGGGGSHGGSITVIDPHVGDAANTELFDHRGIPVHHVNLAERDIGVRAGYLLKLWAYGYSYSETAPAGSGGSGMGDQDEAGSDSRHHCQAFLTG